MTNKKNKLKINKMVKNNNSYKIKLFHEENYLGRERTYNSFFKKNKYKQNKT